LFASLWVVATQVRASLTIFELSSVKSSWSESSIKAAMHSKLHFKRKRGESERWRRSSAGCERVQAHGEEATQYVTLCTRRKVKLRKIFKGLLKREDEAFKRLWKNTLLRACASV